MNKAAAGRKRYELIIFDWDGTLADSLSQIIVSMQYAISKSDLDHRNDSEIRDIIGLGLNEALFRLFPEINDTECALLVKYYREHYVTANTDKVSLFPNVKACLRELKELGYQLAIATGKAGKA